MPDPDKNSIWVEGVEPAPAKTAPAKPAPSTPFEDEFGPPLKRMPDVQDVTKSSYRKRLTKT